MIKVDFHSHSLFSNCGLHSYLELLEYGKKIGMKGLAITDHGPELHGRLNSVFFERLINPVKGIKLLKGVECNLKDENGNIDFPMHFMKYTDIILLGIHPNTEKGLGKEKYTDMLLKAIRKNPYIDILSHPNDQEFEIDLLTVAQAAKELDIVLEINNSKIMLNRIDLKHIEELFQICIETKCKVVLSSDAHPVHELGLDDSIIPFIKKFNFPHDLIINDTVKKAFQFIEERRKIKQKYF